MTDHQDRAARPHASRRTGHQVSRLNKLTGLMLAILALAGLGMIGMLATGSRGSSPFIPFEPGQAETTARAFYGGMNHFLATGDDEFLQLLAPDFQEFRGGALPGNATSLVERLGLMRQSGASPRYGVESVRDLGSVVEVRLAGNQPGDLDVAGLAVNTHHPPVVVEYLSLRRDIVVARWSRDDRIPLTDLTLDASFSPEVRFVEASGLSFVEVSAGVEQITLDPGAEFALPRQTYYGLIATQDAISIQTGNGSEQLASGDARLIAPEGRTRIVNPGMRPSEFWLIPLEDTRAGYGAASASGVEEKRWLWSPEQRLPSSTERLRLRVSRVVLPPGSQFPAHRVGIAEGLLVIDGALDVTIVEREAQLCFPDGRSSILHDRAALGAGDGISASPNALISYRVSGNISATLLVLTVILD